MSFWNQLRSWTSATVYRPRMEREMDAELRFHIEARVEDLLRNGAPRETALRQARRASIWVIVTDASSWPQPFWPTSSRR